MNKTISGAEMSAVIREMVDEAVAYTEQFVQKVGRNAHGNDTVTIMINNEKITFQKEDYIVLKNEMQKRKEKMKKDIKQNISFEKGAV